MPRLHSALPLLALLAACVGEKGPLPDCGLTATAATADTIAHYQVGGTQIVVDSLGGWQSSYYTPGNFLELVFEDDRQTMAWRLTPFHGVGAYPVYPGSQAFPVANPAFFCADVPGEIWVVDPATFTPDTVYVTAYDTTTSVVQGTFSFNGIGYRFGTKLAITAGSFRVHAPKY